MKATPFVRYLLAPAAALSRSPAHLSAGWMRITAAWSLLSGGRPAPRAQALLADPGQTGIDSLDQAGHLAQGLAPVAPRPSTSAPRARWDLGRAPPQARGGRRRRARVDRPAADGRVRCAPAIEGEQGGEGESSRRGRSAAVDGSATAAGKRRAETWSCRSGRARATLVPDDRRVAKAPCTSRAKESSTNLAARLASAPSHRA